MRVWIDQDMCTGHGGCARLAPAVFVIKDDALAYVQDGTGVKDDPGGPGGLAEVPPELEDVVRRAADECPGACISVDG